MLSFHRLFVAAGLLVVVQTGPSVAAEWSLAANVEQRFETDSNFRLRQSSEGFVFGSTSSIGVRLAARTETTRWNIITGTALTAFAGGGDDSGLDRADPRVRGGFIHKGKRFGVGAAFRFSRSPVPFTQFGFVPPPPGSVILPSGTVVLPDDTVVPLDDFETISDEKAIRTLLTLRSGMNFNVDARNQVSLTASGRIERFSDEAIELVDTNSYGTMLSWERAFNERTSTKLSFGFQHATADDIENTNILGMSTTAGLDTKLTPHLTVGFDAGFNVADINRDLPGRDETPFRFAGEFRLAWGSADTQLSLQANHGLTPSSLGDLQRRSNVGVAIEHSINSRSEVSLLASFSRQEPTDSSDGNDHHIFALSPGYAIDLSPNLQARMGYVFRFRGGNGFATSNNVFVEINRSFDLLQ